MMRDRGHLGSAAVVGAAIVAGICAGCSSPAPASGGRVAAVGAENEYADVISQIGGPQVQVSAIMSNPNTDPHSFEASASVSQTVSAAALVVQNGVGYDGFMNTIEKAALNTSRRVINVQHLLGLPDSTPNPHLWYDPATMPKVADALAADYAALKPADASYFTANATRFVASLNPWLHALASFKSHYAGTPVATTEPVADYMLQAASADNLTPFRFQ